jgi:hypothetical protein
MSRACDFQFTQEVLPRKEYKPMALLMPLDTMMKLLQEEETKEGEIRSATSAP